MTYKELRLDLKTKTKNELIRIIFGLFFHIDKINGELKQLKGGYEISDPEGEQK